MLRWFRRGARAGERALRDDRPSDAGDVIGLVRHLSGLVPAPHRAGPVLQRVNAFLSLSEEEQERTFPDLYLLLEQYLVEVEGGGEEMRERVCAVVRERCASLLRLPHVAPIFQPPGEQELYLCKELLTKVLDRAFTTLGERRGDLFPHVRAWVAGVPDAATLPVPFSITEELPKTRAGWISVLRTLSHEVHQRLDHTLGQAAANRMYRQVYDELAALYVGLDTFPVVVGLLPDTLLDEPEIRLLSRSRMQRVLIEKVEHLEPENEQLALKNAELERTWAELESSKGDLERRVEERTAELRAEMEGRRLVEQAKRDAEVRFRSVVESLGEGIIITDLQDVILYVNTRMAELTGYQPDEMIGKRAYELLLPDREWDRARGRTEARRRGISERYVVQLHRKDGLLFWAEVSAQPYRDHQGNIVGTLGTNTGITSSKKAAEEREHLEAQVRHAQKLESLGVLAGGVAHEFNNLLTSMLGHAALAYRKLPADSPARRNIEQIETAAQRAADLTKQMLAYSGKGQLVMRLINLTKLVEEMEHLLRTVISKKATLRYSLTEELPAVEGDPGQLRQVVMNLITNASDALGERGGTIAISTGRMHVKLEQITEFVLGENIADGEYVLLEVSDSGCGMDAQTKARIFDPFFSTKFSGRGLGLAAVLGIVRGHGGAIRVKSELRRGTTFTVLFPPSSEREP